MPFFGYVAKAMRPQKACKWSKIAQFYHQPVHAEQVYLCAKGVFTFLMQVEKT